MGSGYPRKNIRVVKELAGSSLPVDCPDRAGGIAHPVTDPPQVGVGGELAVRDDALVLIHEGRSIATVENARLKACVMMGHSYEGRLVEREGAYEVEAHRI